MTPAKDKALAALLMHPTQKQAAEACGIAPRTMREYLSDEEFSTAYRDACREMVEDATRQAQQSLNVAITTLREVCEDEEAAAGSRISAARSLLEYGLRMTELWDILATLAKIEAAG